MDGNGEKIEGKTYLNLTNLEETSCGEEELHVGLRDGDLAGVTEVDQRLEDGTLDPVHLDLD